MNINQEIIILGAGGHAKELASYIHDLVNEGEKLSLLGFVDDHKPKGPFAGSKILGGFKELPNLLSFHPCVYYITAAGDDALRMDFVKKIEALLMKNLKAWTLRHPKACVGQEVVIGEGTCLCPGSVVTTHARIGMHCIVNVNVSVSHDVTIGDFTNLNPGVRICGNVEISEACYIGAGATVIDKVKIGKGVIIGAGAVVTEDIPDDVTAVGVPAKIIKKHAAFTH